MQHLRRAFEALRGFRADATSRNSTFAVTPALQGLFLEIDTHTRLLRLRGVEPSAAKKLTTVDVAKRIRALPNKKKVRSCMHKDPDFAKAARLVEAVVFERYVRSLRSISWDATKRAKRIKGETAGAERARTQHEALASHAAKLADYVDHVVRLVMPMR